MTLAPPLISAVNKYGGLVDTLARKRYGVSGEALLAKLIQGESGGVGNRTSKAGAKGYTQFMPGSRQTAIQRFGVDPWAGPDQAVHAAALHLLGKINGSTGLEGYNPGDSSYSSYILGQKVGDVRRAGSGGGGTPTGGSVSVQVPQAGSTFDPGPQAASTLAGLIGQQQAPPPVQVPQAPHAVIQSPVVNAQPTTDSGIGGLLDAIRTPTMDLPTTGQQGSTKVSVSGGPTASAASVGSGRSPTARPGKLIGFPYQGTHTLGNWQSDRAVDIAVPKGTPMVALQDGQVVKVTKHPQGSGRFAGDQITIRGANGNEYFYAHGVSSVQAGQRIRKGQQLGVTGSANGVEHLHFAQMKGDPFMHVGGRR